MIQILNRNTNTGTGKFTYTDTIALFLFRRFRASTNTILRFACMHVGILVKIDLEPKIQSARGFSRTDRAAAPAMMSLTLDVATQHNPDAHCLPWNRRWGRALTPI